MTETIGADRLLLLAVMIVDAVLCSSTGVSNILFCMLTGDKGKGGKENRPKATRDKGENRAKNTSKGLAEAQTGGLLVRADLQFSGTVQANYPA